MTSRGPYYNLKEVRSLVLASCYRSSKRVGRTLHNHGYIDTAEVVEGVFGAIEESHFHKCDELKNLPGTMADIYHSVPWDDQEWYVKFFMRDGEPVVDIWSLKEMYWM